MPHVVPAMAGVIAAHVVPPTHAHQVAVFVRTVRAPATGLAVELDGDLDLCPGCWV